MRKVLKIIGIIILVLIVALVISMIRSARRSAEDQARIVKSDDELIGTHFYVPRDGKDIIIIGSSGIV